MYNNNEEIKLVKSKKEVIKCLLVIFFATVTTFPENCMATPVPYISFPDLVSKSDIICKGEILQVYKIGESEERAGDDGRLLGKINTKVALMRIDRILKGDETSETVEVEFEEVFAGVILPRMMLKKGEYVLLFLKREGERYRLTFKYYDGEYRAKIPVSSKELQIEAEGSNPSALVQQELLNSLRNENPNVILPSLIGLEGIKSKASIMHIENLLDSNDLAVKGQALSTLINIGSINHIAEAINYIDEQPATKAQEVYKTKIIYALENIRDANAVPQLHTLLKHQNALVRREIVRSLRQIRNPSSVPYLIVGLDDSNVNVRYQCVMGIAETLEKGGDWAPSYKIFLEDESKPISLWKAWWQKEGKEKFGVK
jgi:hypothetical protein